MKLELKNIKVYDRMSDETNCFSADIFVNGKKAGYAQNDGRGGYTFYHSYPDNSKLIEEAEKYALTLAPINYGNFTINSNLENFIDKKVSEYIDSKFNKKREKAMLTGIVYGADNYYSVHKFKNSSLLSDVLKDPKGVEAIQKMVNKLKEKGYKILNTNLPSEIIL